MIIGDTPLLILGLGCNSCFLSMLCTLVMMMMSKRHPMSSVIQHQPTSSKTSWKTSSKTSSIIQNVIQNVTLHPKHQLSSKRVVSSSKTTSNIIQNNIQHHPNRNPKRPVSSKTSSDNQNAI